MDCKHLRAVLAAMACAAPAAAQTLNLPMDMPVTVNGIETVCTGIGDAAQKDARWAGYPLKIELAGKGGQFLTDADITVSQGGATLTAVHCGGPWLLLKVPAGRYEISGVVEGQNASAKAVARASGQTRAILRFPGKGGALSPEHKATQ